ncbi:HpcH/HpaI aldolase/citrate lyase family protein [Ahrensia sp. 13_GOM-1096m]|uniref:HpcH/HpaI aldolase family protein n=1 Tax=Ahrensia sp. 13_GOM-1096m TaxID=1380380 RepID=UPI0004798FB4|nr:aldolase/citrate lyase family protein [Ahrensia sp. 13_GOM-1096m]
MANPYQMVQQLSRGDTLLTAWSSLPSVDLVDQLATTEFDAVTLDMQHGGHDEKSVWDGLLAIINRQKCAVVRIPVGRNDMASRALDMGADAIIAPMINSVEDAKAFADSMKFPPLGNRSWGAPRAQSLRDVEGGNAFLKSANKDTLSLAMIETRQALAALDDILSVEGIDGVFVGPSDLSIAWTNGDSVDPTREDMMEAIALIAKKAKAANKFAGIFSVDPSDTPRFTQMGFQFIALGFETGLITAGATQFLAAAKGGKETKLDGGY